VPSAAARSCQLDDLNTGLVEAAQEEVARAAGIERVRLEEAPRLRCAGSGLLAGHWGLDRLCHHGGDDAVSE
jgi:hypothetical protein